MRLSLAITAVIAAFPALAQTPAEPLDTPPGEDTFAVEIGPPTIATLRALDKVTAEISELQLPRGESVSFGSLRIVSRHCYSRPPEEPPETFVFLEIDDQPPGAEAPERAFTGWMVASSPALNPLEHPVYDVWVLSCRTVEGDASEASE